ncbi:site-2 protease family protein [Candidatus Poseidoniaceae archaeon]|jgi:membrane-associated protease RseP (regulator of RpoE activity)|nr:site-2 protease family protein [Candidatus Poseidoniaceae archaeon]
MGSGFLSVEFGWTEVLLFVIAWYLLLRYWEKTGKLDQWNASRVFFGMILMVRTDKGQKSLETISKPRKFWRAYGEVSLWVCWGAMFIVTVMIILAVVAAILMGNQAEARPVSELVAIPGLSPIIPLGYGIFAFVVCLVIHEFGHGIQARAHGMRVRSFGLLMMGPIPLGAFAEPEYTEISTSPRRERQRMFAAGPATNIFAALILMVILGQVGGQFTAADPGVHSSQIVLDSAADDAGLEAWDVIVSINGTEIVNGGDFANAMDDISAGQIVPMEVIRYGNGTNEVLLVNMSDKYDYLSDLGYDSETLDSMGIEKGDAFLGVNSPSGGTAGVDRLARWNDPNFGGSALGYALSVPVSAGTILFTPFEYQGVAIHPAQEDMLDSGDGWLASILGLNGLLILMNLLFWLIWVNILLGFTNLFPMIPFDGGHLFKDIVHGTMSGIRNLGKKTGLYNMHPLWVEHVTRKASSLSSILLLLVMVILIGGPYFALLL